MSALCPLLRDERNQSDVVGSQSLTQGGRPRQSFNLPPQGGRKPLNAECEKLRTQPTSATPTAGGAASEISELRRAGH